MSRTSSLAALSFVLALPAAGAGGPTPTPTPTPRRAVLVEAEGRGELEALVARLESDLADSGKLGFTDARLAGASFGALASDPQGSAARSFREEFPGTLLLSLSLAPCESRTSVTQIPDTTPEGYRIYRQIVNRSVRCSVLVRAADPLTGRSYLNENVEGAASVSDATEPEESPELEATRKAATKAAKKLVAIKH